MSKNQDMKKQQVVEITDKLKNAKSMVMVQYVGLTVDQATRLRKNCRENKVEYCVLKNTLVRRALDDLGIKELDEKLEGPNAFAIGAEDAISAAKVISDFIEKEKTTALTIKGGLLEGKAVDAKTIHELASLPSREVLLSRLVGSMSATVGNFVRVVEAFRKKQAGEE